MKKKINNAQIQAIEDLRVDLRPGTEVYTSISHVSKSGMSRSIKLYYMYVDIDEKPHIREISYLASQAMNDKLDNKNGGIKVQGCGMDMGFHIVYNLSYTLYPEGFLCVGEKCPSNDHFNQIDIDYHKDGGYALKQRWL